MQTTQQKLDQANIIIKEFQGLRDSQKEYFRTRDFKVLEKCKVQEKKVDALIKEYNDFKAPTLF